MSKPDEINLIEIFQSLNSHRALILIGAIIFTSLGTIYQFKKKDLFLGKCIIYYNKEDDNSGMGTFPSIPGIFGKEEKSYGDIDVVLESRSFFERVSKVIWPNTVEEKVSNKANYLLSKFKVTKLKDSKRLELEFEEVEPDKCKYYLEVICQELDEALRRREVHRVTETLTFLESRVKEVKIELDKSTNDVKDFLINNKGMDVPSQSKNLTTLVNNLIRQRVEKELELAILKKSFGENTPDVIAHKQNIEELNNKIEEIKVSDQKNSLSSLPHLQFEYENLLSEHQLKVKIYALLRERLELEKVNLNKNSSYIEIIDPPLLPDTPFYPKRPRFILLCFFSTLIGLSLLSIFRDLLKKGFSK